MSYTYCGIQQNGVVTSASSRSNNSIYECRSSAVCPKPRRVGLNSSVTDPSRPLRWHLGHQAEVYDARAGSELLDIMLSKGGQGNERANTQVASSPPFFSGSPPSRVSNPIIQDARFKVDKQLIPPFSPLPSPIPTTLGSASSPNTSVRKGGCVRPNFGNYPAVRVEGFDCLDRDRHNCSIPGLA
ncbi:uncharacterized protein LOC141623416 [Silene latifolia]|uniref:uncharacterized protein LOC141623416 n=1 Tax=Silene latifolia TaxID=37657 RepID=UPI003D772F7C